MKRIVIEPIVRTLCALVRRHSHSAGSTSSCGYNHGTPGPLHRYRVSVQIADQIPNSVLLQSTEPSRIIYLIRRSTAVPARCMPAPMMRSFGPLWGLYRIHLGLYAGEKEQRCSSYRELVLAIKYLYRFFCYLLNNLNSLIMENTFKFRRCVVTGYSSLDRQVKHHISINRHHNCIQHNITKQN